MVEPLRLRPTLPLGSGAAERLSLLRREIAGLTAMAPNLAATEAPARVSLGAARFDARLTGGLATGTLHEIVAAAPGDAPATAGFTLALAARLRAARAQAPLVWIGEDFAGLEQGALYGPGLALHGIDPSALVLIRAAHAKDALWAMEEALKCRAPAAIVGEIFSAKLYDLTASRRLLLAAAAHGTTGLLCLAGVRAEALSSSAATRFEIRARPSPQRDSAGLHTPLPGLAGFDVRLAKARAGPAGLMLDHDTFHPVLWNPQEACFSDALSLPLAAVAGNGPDRPPQRRRA
jgi:protein ImuA